MTNHVIQDKRSSKTAGVKGHEGSLSVRLVTDPRSLEQDVALWANLSQHVAEPNAFYEPWFMQAAWKCLAPATQRWQIAIVERTTPAGTEWCGLFPFVQHRWRLQLWQHDQCFLTTPLVRTGLERDVLLTLFTELQRNRTVPGLLQWPIVNGSGRLYAAFVDVSRQLLLSRFTRDEYNRALLCPWSSDHSEAGVQVFLQERFGGHHLRELRRQRRRLEDSGTLELRQLQNENQLSLWTEWFLELESSGWKGRDGTALNCQPHTREFFKKMVAAGFPQGAVEMFGLFVHGEPIALKVNLLSGSGSFSFKIAFREDLSKFSPGVQLEVDHLREFQASGRAWMDSCAVADHSMINRLWADRRPVQDLLISTGRISSDILVSAMPLARAFFRGVKRTVQAVAKLCSKPSPSENAK